MDVLGSLAKLAQHKTLEFPKLIQPLLQWTNLMVWCVAVQMVYVLCFFYCIDTDHEAEFSKEFLE